MRISVAPLVSPTTLLVVYGLAGRAGTAHTVLWPDFVGRGLGLGTRAGAVAWLGFASLGRVLFGAGLAAAPAALAIAT